MRQNSPKRGLSTGFEAFLAPKGSLWLEALVGAIWFALLFFGAIWFGEIIFGRVWIWQ